MADEEIIIDVKGINELAKKINAIDRPQVLMDGLLEGALWIGGWIKKYRLSGPRPLYLGVVTNRLRSSIAAKGDNGTMDTILDRNITGNTLRVELGTNVEYAAIHEFGGLAGRNRSVAIPARPFMQPGIEDKANQQEVLDFIVEKINKAIEDAAR